MGVERAVTRWYVQRQFILNEIALLEEALAQTTTDNVMPATGETSTVEQQLARTQEKLRALGPCPKPMMG